jgi:hypothetical protein
VRKWVPVALLMSATVAACGGRLETPPPTTSPTDPVTFSVSVTTPTSTIPEPVTTSYPGPQGFPIQTGPFLAPATTTRLGAITDGIQCVSLPQLAYTAYAHLQVYVDGHSRALPGGVGMVGPVAKVTPKGLLFSPRICMYWLHTRAADGLIEAQSPIPRDFTLGEFFRIWNQPLSSSRVGPARGPVTATVDGKRWRGDPSAIPLGEHADIQLAVGSPVPAPTPVEWAGTGL